jgi:gluconate 2-dehydrogenase
MDATYKVLVTGNTFILPQHEAKLQAHSIAVDRLNVPAATEDQLIQNVQGKDGYILGGIERVTTPVIEAAESLKAICFTGAGWTEFIPAHELATAHGIAITAAPGANAQAVAELAVGLIHERARNISYLSGVGFGERIKARQFRSMTLGIVGAGNIGSKVARLMNGAYGTRILYYSPRRNLDLEFSTGATPVSLETLASDSDIISLHMRKSPATTGIIDAELFGRMREGAILINTAFAEAIDPWPLYEAVGQGKISAALDVTFRTTQNKLPDFKSVSPRHFLQIGFQSGFYTDETTIIASDIATNAMIDLLTNGVVPSVVVNLEYRANSR